MSLAGAGSEKLLFDFSAPESVAAWHIVNDDVMGGISSSSFRWSNGVAWFAGKLSLENNGGFASVRSQPATFQLGGYASFLVRVRGDGCRYKFTIRTSPSFDSPLYQLSFPTEKGEWQEHRLPFKDFTPTFRGRILSGEPALNAGKITCVGFLISDNQKGPFALEVGWIKALK